MHTRSTSHDLDFLHATRVVSYANPAGLALSLCGMQAKLLALAARAWQGFAASEPGLAAGIPCGVLGLGVRVVERWRYDVGGCLDDDWHYDNGSVLTVVCQLSAGFKGGCGSFKWSMLSIARYCDNLVLMHGAWQWMRTPGALILPAPCGVMRVPMHSPRMPRPLKTTEAMQPQLLQAVSNQRMQWRAADAQHGHG